MELTMEVKKSSEEIKALREKRNRTHREKEKENRHEEVFTNAPCSTHMFKAIKVVTHNPNLWWRNPIHFKCWQNSKYSKRILLEKICLQGRRNNPLSIKPIPLPYPITPNEINKAFNKLKNNQAAGEDEIPGELLKYAPNEFGEIVSQWLNNIFTNHRPLNINNNNALKSLPNRAKKQCLWKTKDI